MWSNLSILRHHSCITVTNLHTVVFNKNNQKIALKKIGWRWWCSFHRDHQNQEIKVHCSCFNLPLLKTSTSISIYVRSCCIGDSYTCLRIDYLLCKWYICTLYLMIVTTKDKMLETTRVVKSSEWVHCSVQCFGIWLTLKFMIGPFNPWLFTAPQTQPPCTVLIQVWCNY